MYGTGLCLDSEEKLLEYLAFLKGRHDDPKSEKSQAFQEFMILLERAKKIIAAMYQEDEEENGGKRSGSLRISVLRIWKRLSAAGSPLIKWEISKDVRIHSGKAFQPEALQPPEDQQYPEP